MKTKGDKEKEVHDVLMASDLDKNPVGDMKDVKGKEYKMGMEMEGEEHKDIAHGDVGIIHKIVMAHLKENPKYYSMLKEMEEDEKEKE
jgi:hypothetical protein